MKLRKFIDKKQEGEYEIIKNHIVEIQIDREVIRDFCLNVFIVGDDPEYDFTKYGILTDEEGEPDYIIVNTFLNAIDERKAESDEEIDPSDYEEIQKLAEYRGYNLLMDS
ncbi:MAG: hypothetical protein U9M89_00585 [Patescibacteria group bacterium]|nr:hypothetical protein [Patescibacteria group bacterium]